MSKEKTTNETGKSQTYLRLDEAHIEPVSEEERAVYLKLYDLVSRGDFHIEHVAELVGEHPPIAQRLIRVTNSGRAGLRRRITRLKHAIVMLGAHGIRDFSEPVVASLSKDEANNQTNESSPLN